MKITLYVSPSLTSVLGQRKLFLDVPDKFLLVDLLQYLQETYPGLEDKLNNTQKPGAFPYTYFINRKAIETMGTNRLNDGDQVHILVPVGGG